MTDGLFNRPVRVRLQLLFWAFNGGFALALLLFALR